MPTERAQILSKTGTRHFENSPPNSPPFERKFWGFPVQKNFLKKGNFFQITGVPLFSSKY